MTSQDPHGTPPIPPVPTYGEYASPEHAEAARLARSAPPVAQQPQPPQQPQYGAQQQPPYGAPQYGQQQPPHGAPQYGQQPYGAPQAPYQQPLQQPYQPQYAQQPYQPNGQPQYWNGQRPLRTGDMIASIILLVVGFFGTIYAVLNAVSLNLQFDAIYEEYGVSDAYVPGPGATVAMVVIIVSHVILLGVATLVTIPLIRKRKVSFWVPLVAGGVAAVIFAVVVLVVIFTDPNLMNAIMEQSQP